MNHFRARARRAPLCSILDRWRHFSAASAVLRSAEIRLVVPTSSRRSSESSATRVTAQSVHPYAAFESVCRPYFFARLAGARVAVRAKRRHGGSRLIPSSQRPTASFARGASNCGDTGFQRGRGAACIYVHDMFSFWGMGRSPYFR